MDLNIGISSVMMSEGMNEVSISVAIYNGTLKPGGIATIFLQLQSPRGN